MIVHINGFSVDNRFIIFTEIWQGRGAKLTIYTIDFRPVDPKELPPEQVNLLLELTSGIQAMGRNIAGRCCLYEPGIDRFVAITKRRGGEPDEATWRYVARYFVIPQQSSETQR